MTLRRLKINPRPLDSRKGIICLEGKTLACALGKTGLTAFKREGDGATPIIRCRPMHGFYRADRENLPLSSLPFFPIRDDMGWCDDANHPSYNQLVRLPFQASHERMKRDDALYDMVLVLDVNISVRKKQCGSALFMHVAREGYRPTEGCVALAKQDLRLLLAHLSHETVIDISRLL